MVSLIANPNRFDEQRIDVRGWAVIEGPYEAGALFLMKEDLDFENLASGVALRHVTGVGTFEGYLRVIGTFHAGDVPSFPGRIEVEKAFVLKPTPRSD